MTRKPATRRIQSGIGWVAAAAGIGAAVYAASVAVAWGRYGRRAAACRSAEPLLDRFLPDYEVLEHHQVNVSASPEVTFAAAAAADLQQSRLVRAIFRARELVLGTESAGAARSRGLLEDMSLLGWGKLAEEPGRAIAMGAVTQPWLPRVTFRALPPDDFAVFREPGYVKIAWTLRAAAADWGGSALHTETRVATTDPSARRMFRWYWARFSPGILLIRRMLLRQVKKAAERR